MTESELPPECLDDDPPAYCYSSTAEQLPEAGHNVLELVGAIAIMLLVMGLMMAAVIHATQESS